MITLSSRGESILITLSELKHNELIIFSDDDRYARISKTRADREA